MFCGPVRCGEQHCILGVSLTAASPLHYGVRPDWTELLRISCSPLTSDQWDTVPRFHLIGEHLTGWYNKVVDFLHSSWPFISGLIGIREMCSSSFFFLRSPVYFKPHNVTNKPLRVSQINQITTTRIHQQKVSHRQPTNNCCKLRWKKQASMFPHPQLHMFSKYHKTHT